jgi:CBS domain-containing protein
VIPAGDKYYYLMLSLITCVSALLLAALEMLVQHRITGLPVVDASGRVVSSNAGSKPAEVQLQVEQVQRSKGIVADRSSQIMSVYQSNRIKHSIEVYCRTIAVPVRKRSRLLMSLPSLCQHAALLFDGMLAQAGPAC